MKSTPESRSVAFSRVLREEELHQPRSRFIPGYWDEVALYSRYRQVEQLGLVGAELDQEILRLSLTYLDSVCAQIRVEERCFVGLSMMDPDGDPIDPCIYVANGHQALEAMRQGTHLAHEKSGFCLALEEQLLRLEMTRYRVDEVQNAVRSGPWVFVSRREVTAKLTNCADLLGEP